MPDQIVERPIPPAILRLHRRCELLYRVWWATHYSIGILGVFAGGTAGVVAGRDAASSWGWLSGLVAAVSTSLVTFLGPLHRAERYWKAYHALDQACVMYAYGLIELLALVTEAQRARELVISGLSTTEELGPSTRATDQIVRAAGTQPSTDPTSDSRHNDVDGRATLQPSSPGNSG
jgi:hypothetical protein